MRKSDFILFLGDRMQQWEIDWEYNKKVFGKAKLAQIDIDPEEIGRVYPIDLSAVGSIISFLKNKKHQKHQKHFQIKQKLINLEKKYFQNKKYKDYNGINPININNIVQENISKDAIIITDTGYTGSMAITKFKTNLHQKFLISDKNSPMGYGVPAALGASLFDQKKEIICFVGDGSFQMSLNELALIKEYKLKVIYIIENNNGCVMIKDSNIQEYKKSSVDTFINPDYTKIAEGYNMQGHTVKTSEKFEEVFKKAQKSKKSVIIDAKINQNIMVW